MVESANKTVACLYVQKICTSVGGRQMRASHPFITLSRLASILVSDIAWKDARNFLWRLKTLPWFCMQRLVDRYSISGWWGALFGWSLSPPTFHTVCPTRLFLNDFLVLWDHHDFLFLVCLFSCPQVKAWQSSHFSMTKFMYSRYLRNSGRWLIMNIVKLHLIYYCFCRRRLIFAGLTPGRINSWHLDFDIPLNSRSG